MLALAVVCQAWGPALLALAHHVGVSVTPRRVLLKHASRMKCFQSVISTQPASRRRIRAPSNMKGGAASTGRSQPTWRHGPRSELPDFESE